MAFLRDRSVFCLNFTTSDPTGFYNKNVYSIVCIVTSTIGLIGAAVQLKTWRRLLPLSEKRRRTSPNPQAIFCLALSDFGACLGIITLSVILLSIPSPVQCAENLKYRCPARSLSTGVLYTGVIIEHITQFCYVSSYIWTFCYALDVFFQVKKVYCHNVVFHILSWGISFIFVLMVFLSNVLFYVPGKDGEKVHTVCSEFRTLEFRYMISYVPVIVTAVLMVVFYALSVQRIRLNVTKYGLYSNNERQIIKAVKRKFFALTGFFILCWFPNMIEFFTVIAANVDLNLREVRLFIMWFLEALLNPLQGFFNCFLYGQSKYAKTSLTDQAIHPVLNTLMYDGVEDNATQVERTQDMMDPLTQDFATSSGSGRDFLYNPNDDTEDDITIVGSLPRAGPFMPKLLGDPTR